MSGLKELVDPLYIGLHIANFIVLAIVLRRLLYKPVKKLMDRRNELVAEQQRKLMEADADIQRKRQEMETDFTQREEKMQADQAAAMAAVSEKAEHIIAKAQTEAEDILTAGRANVEREQQSAIANMDVTIAELAVEIAGRLIQSQLSPQEQKALVQQGIQEAKTIAK